MHDPEKDAREAIRGCLKTAYDATPREEAIPDEMRALLAKIAARSSGEKQSD